ncbi:MAG TPA: histidine kinase [bacterium]|nr:histidine kinase [bacterium]
MGRARFAARHAWPRAFRLLIVLLPALVVFGAEVVRHEVLHGAVPEMLGNALTGIAALCISALILVPIYRRLEAAGAQLRATEIEQAVSQERERLARELHDGISQALFFLNVKATALDRSLGAADATGARPIAAEIAQTVQDTSRSVRDAIFDLRTSPGPGQSFTAWARTYVHRFGEIHGLAGSVEEEGGIPELPLEPQLHAMAIVREALHNVAKHARAHMVRVSIGWEAGEVIVAIGDDGKGIPDRLPGQGRYGLSALREHARAVGGTVTVTRGLGGIGTSIVFRMPHAQG